MGATLAHASVWRSRIMRVAWSPSMGSMDESIRMSSMSPLPAACSASTAATHSVPSTANKTSLKPNLRRDIS